MAQREELSDEKWKVIEVLVPKRGRRADGRGRPPKEEREVVNGILWVPRSGARWQDLRVHHPANLFLRWLLF